MKLQAQSTLGAPFGVAATVPGFTSRNAVLRELADIGCVLLTAAVDNAEIAASASAVAGVDLPLVHGMIKTGVGRLALWLSPRSWLVQCGLEEEVDLIARLNATFPDKRAHATGFTDYLCWFELSGAASLDLLTESTFVSLERGGLPVGHAKRTLIAQIAAVVIRKSENAWMIAVERSRARYFADWLSASAAPKQ
jgi:heterotetrameric sarcosine oxidase gamma subunit